MNKKERSNPKAPIRNSLSQSTLQQEIKCAYHPKQSITNFCKCEQCLLPVCPTCIKVHTDQHKQSKTTPKFQEINKVVQEIRASYDNLYHLVEEIRAFLVQVQTNKKHAESKIREKIIEHRKILIKQFQRHLIEMENRIMERIVEVDEEFIQRIDAIDSELSKTRTQILRGSQGLYSQDLLKHIIVYFGNHSEEKLHRQVSSLKSQSNELTKNNLVLDVRKEELETIQRAIQRYVRVDIKDNQFLSNTVRSSHYDQ